MGFAVKESTGITSLAQIKRAYSVAACSGHVLQRPGKQCNRSRFPLRCAAGFTLADMRKGGKFHSSPALVIRAGARGRERHHRCGLDEGIKSWGQTASTMAFVICPLKEPCWNSSPRSATGAPPSRCARGLSTDIQTIDVAAGR
jgi:hypothetical protein